MDRETTLRLILAGEPQILERINEAWELPPNKRMDWRKLEGMLREIIRSSLTADQKVFAFDEVLAATTRRGHSLPWSAPTTSMVAREKVQEIRDRQKEDMQ